MALIYAVEDDKNILEIEMFALKNSGYQVDGFECARDFYKKLDERQPDLVLLDIMLPDEDGLEIVGKLRRRPETKKLPVIMVTAKTTEIDKVKGLDVGADDYLTKPFNSMELIARGKSQVRRYTTLGDIHAKTGGKTIEIGRLCYDLETRSLFADGEPVHLTATESKIFDLLIRNAGRIFPAEEIYERVWNEPAFSAENTVMVHIRRIREKIELNPKEPEYLKVVWGIGYKIEKHGR